MSEINRRSLTPCLDENRVDDDPGGDNSKEIELSDISDEDDGFQWPDVSNGKTAANGNGKSKSDQLAFKKITRSNRDRNYRDKVNKRDEDAGGGGDRKASYSEKNTARGRYRKPVEVRRKQEIPRYDVRKVIANRDFSISRSRSRSFSPAVPRHRRGSYSPSQRRGGEAASPIRPYHSSATKSHRYSDTRHSPSLSPDRYRNYQQYKSLTPPETFTVARRSRSRNKHSKLSKTSDREVKKKKHRSKDHQHKHRKKSRSSSLSPHTSSPSRQIMNVANSNLAQENIKVILKNDDAFAKRQVKSKKREKKGKKDKLSKKEKNAKEPQKKEVFASGDNILISVCFNKNNNNNITTSANNNHVAVNEEKSSKEVTTTEVVAAVAGKSKSKRRQPSPTPSISSVDSLNRHEQRRQRKHKRKKIKSGRKEVGPSKEIPRTPPPATTVKRKNDAKPIAIIDLEKSPGKEIIQSPKEVIVLSDSDGGGGNKMSKDIIIVEDITIVEKGSAIRNHSPRELLSPKHVTPESPPPTIPVQPVLKFALKSKSNILPFNLLHDQADEIEEPPPNTTAGNANNNSGISNESAKDQQETVNTSNNNSEDKNACNQTLNEAYDPFEPTKSRSTSPMTPPHPHPNDMSSSSDTLKNKIDSLNEKIQKDSVNQISNTNDDHAPSSIWTRKEFDGKKMSSAPITPPMPPSFVFSSSSSAQISKQPHSVSLYDGIYGNDLKTPVVPSPIKSNLKSNNNKDMDDDDDRTPYSPSSDGYDYEPPPPSMHTKSAFENIKHSDIETQSSEPSGSFSFGADDTTVTKTTPLKLTASTLKTFNSTMRTTGPVGLNYVNKAELSIFENYLPPTQQKSPLVKRQTNASGATGSGFVRKKMSRFSNINENGSPQHRNIMSYNEPLKAPVIDESLLDDEVPSSAVDLVNKDRFLKKSLRIERVAEEVKLVLKPHYNKKHITKDEYKEILRKAVPKICHSKTGAINIQKITQLIEAYIKKFRYKRKVGIASSI